ncbi:hypothetical protein LA6_003958 [Marinibacterium anthonyi]|nr:hypothetical protein LA6_003958 [Marinibacterium anthonyi]
MKRKAPAEITILGVTAPRPRPTLAGAFWLAMVISLIFGAFLCTGEALWRLAL